MTSQRYEPFPLTDTQRAYLIGRGDFFPLGNVSTHACLEYDAVIDLGRFTASWAKVVARHDMLRAVIDPEAATQRVLESVPDPGPVIHDLRGADAGEVAAALASVRETMAHEVRPAWHYPIFGLALSILRDENDGAVAVRMHAGIDGLTVDYASWHVLLRDLAYYYDRPDDELPELTTSFRDYVLATESGTDPADLAEAREYWQRVLPELPGPPQLPLLRDPSTVTHSRFDRLDDRLDPPVWSRLRAAATTRGLSPSGLVLAAFAHVVARFSASPRFTLNVPRMGRDPLFDGVEDLVGEFATFTLVEVDASEREPFADFATRIQRRLWEALGNGSVSGVELLRGLNELHGNESGAGPVLMPVVLTSTLASTLPDSPLIRALRPVYHVTSTPQVYLDVQLEERFGELYVNWDHVIGVFRPGVVEAMFAAWMTLLRSLADSDTGWDRVEPVVAAEPSASPEPGVVNELVHSGFLRQVRHRPTAAALRGADGTAWNYRQLYIRAESIAAQLRPLAAAGPRAVGSEPIVAVAMAKSPDQIAAALAVLLAGFAYLPVDPELPPPTIATLLRRGAAVAVLVDAAASVPAQGIPVLRIDRIPDSTEVAVPDSAATEFEVAAGRLAYVLPTSGSTGEPKLVAIEHAGVVNCLRHTANTFGIGPDDRVLALTALHHDMSLFDMFGVLGAGGCLVVPAAARRADPGHWLDLMAEHDVTLWNSVPAMMRMLLDYRRERSDGPDTFTLRLTFLGGDWFPFDLVTDYRDRFGAAELVSVGGPTETTLWNIWHRVGDPVDGDIGYRDWVSVPYGRPIAGARYHILDDRLLDCPDWVVGELCCSGIGLARGYVNDPDLTAARFVRHPDTGERIYRTGDLGRYHPDGTIEFIGRRDTQVQLRGRRVEPSSVEMALGRHPAVRAAVVTAVAQSTGPGHRALVAHVVAETGEAALRAYLHDELAEYLVPSRILVVDALPLTRTGKVDRRVLTARGEDALRATDRTDGGATEPAANVSESALITLVARAWAEVLGLESVGRHDNFYALGGDSMAATRILARLRRDLAGAEVSARVVLAAVDVLACAAALSAHGGPEVEHRARQALIGDGPVAADVVGTGGDAPRSGPLSPAQRRMWFAERLVPGAASYNLAVEVGIGADVDPASLCAALADVVRRHSGLRTIYPIGADGVPIQRVIERPFEVTRIDGPGPRARIRTAAAAPFELAVELPIRAYLARGEAGPGWSLTLVLHHIAIDDHCWEILFDDLSSAYRARRDGVAWRPPVTDRYLDHVLAQEDRNGRPDYVAGREFWRSHRLGLDRAPTAPPRYSVRRGRELSVAQREALSRTAREYRISETTVLLAAATVALSRRLRRSRVGVGVAVIDRGEPGTEAVLGNFGNLVVVAADHAAVDPAVADPLRRIADASAEAYAHQHIPFDTVVADQRAAYPDDTGPLFDAVFSVRSPIAPGLRLGGEFPATVTALDLGAARFDLVFETTDSGDTRELGVLADAARYRTDEVQSLVDEFHRALISLIAVEKEDEMTDITETHSPTADYEDAIAVIGMSGRFPGAPDLNTFWDNLVAGRESATGITLEQFVAAGGTEAAYRDPAQVSVASVVEGIDRFDADFFGFRPSEAELIDPQQRLFLECCHEALTESGQVPERFDGRIGVYGGTSQSQYFLQNVYPHLMGQPNSMALLPATSGSSPGAVATRVAYKLGLTGPAMSVQTACSTSLVAIHVACQDLLSYQTDVALAGGASLDPNPYHGYQAMPDGPLSTDGHCRAFDAAANGMFPGDGVGVVVLKRLADALADGDPVRAVVLGSAINNDGSRKAGFSAPSPQGQMEVILAAQAAAGVEPDQIGYVEAHGTGTPVGDPIELKALGDAFRAGTDRAGYCLLGSVKTNLGHLDAAAGVASFIKTVLAVENRVVPPSLHFTAPNPLFDLEASPFRVAAELTEWSAERPALAAVSSFGIGGTNAHVILGPAPQSDPRPRTDAGAEPVLLALSARTPSALGATARRLARHLREHPELDLGDIAHTLWTGREWFETRTAVVATSLAEASAALAAAPPARQSRADRPVALVFPGGGTEYPAMGAALYESEPEYRRVIDEARAIVSAATGTELLDALRDPAAVAASAEIPVAFAAIVATEVALAATLADYGVTATALIGHSLGEYAAAVVAGVLSLGDALRVVIEREQLLRRAGGAATSVLLSADDLAGYLGDTLTVATINGPLHCTISGPEADIMRLEEVLEGKGVDYNRLPLPAVHSALLDPELPALAKVLAGVSLSAPRIPLISNVTGAQLTDADAVDPGYWLRHTRETVRFADGIATLHTRYAPLFVEAGPGRGLTRLIELQLGKDAVSPPLMRHRNDTAEDRAYLRAALGGIWAAGVPVELAPTGAAPRTVLLPGYPYERRRFWIDPPARLAAAAPVRALDLFQVLDSREAALRQRIPVEHMEAALDAELEAACPLYVARFLRELGADTAPGSLVDPAVLVSAGGMVDPYDRFFAALLSLLEADGYTERIDGGLLRFTEKLCGEPEFQQAHEQLLTRYPDAEPELAFLDYCSARYRQVCNGEIAGTEVMIVDGTDDRSDEVVDKRLAHSDVAVYTRLVGEVLRELAQSRDRPLRILEVGAGQGYLTWPVAEALHGAPVEYTFTDLGRSFVVAAQRTARERGYDWMRFGVLDISGDAAAQGYTEPFDVVLAFNVLHATPELAVTVAQAAAVLTPGGTLMLLESAQQRRVSMLTAGLFEGWWYFRDDLRTHSPLVAPYQWADLLRGAGLVDVRVQSGDSALGIDGPPVVDHGLIVGVRPAAAVLPSAAEPAASGGGMFGGGSAFNARPALAVPYREPGTDRERHVAAAWQNVLGIDKVGVDDNFFDLGGESLLAMQLVTSLRSELGVTLSVKQFFSSGDLTVGGLVALIDAADAGAGEQRGDVITVSKRRAAVRS